MESSSSKLPLLVFLLFVKLLALALVQSKEANVHDLGKLYEVCPTNKTYGPNTNFGYNLNKLYLSLSLADPEIDDGFFNVSYGEGSDQINAIGMCRGDVNPKVCRSCINEAVDELTEICSDQTEAIVWYDECMFRYSNRSIFGKLEFRPSRLLTTADDDDLPSKVTKQYEQVLTKLLEDLKTQAANGDSRDKFATGQASASGSKHQFIYGLAQCTPDLSQSACEDCLSKAAESILESGVLAARFLAPSCSIRYDNYMFYDGPSVHSPTPRLSPGSPRSDAPVLPPAAPAFPPDTPAPSPLPPVSSPSPSAPPPPSSDEPSLPPSFEESPPPSEFGEFREYGAPPALSPLAPEPEPFEEILDFLDEGNKNSRFQALAIVVALVILQFFAF